MRRKRIAGKVVRVYKEKAEDYTIVSFLLDNGDNFVISSENYQLTIYLQENHQVNITYLDTGEKASYQSRK